MNDEHGEGAALEKINGKGGIIDRLNDHEDRLRTQETFRAYLIGGAAVASILGAVLIEWLKYLFGPH